MDADRSIFWPMVRTKCNFAGRGEDEIFTVIDVLKEYPVNSYLIQSRSTGEIVKAFRHQLFRPAVHEQFSPQIRQSSVETEIDPDILQLFTDGFFDDDMTVTEEPVMAPDIVQLQDHDSDLDKAALDSMDKQAKSKGTLRNEAWSIKKFEEWQLHRKIHIDMATVTAEELGTHLRKFYAEVKAQNGDPLSPSSLRGIRAGIHRRLIGPPFNRAINIIEDREFQAANRMLENMCKRYQTEGNKKQQHYPAIERADLEKVASYLAKYRDSPDNLLHTMWFLICYHFARRGREGFREMSRQTFEVKTDDVGAQYLVAVTTEKSKNWQGGCSSKAWDYSDIRAYGVNLTANISLNIVDVFNFYISKLNPKNDNLFQKPKSKWTAEGCWFLDTPVGKNKLSTIMQIISKNADLSRTYTNHSVRATAITVMYHGGIDTKQICKLTKHKNEESLKHYIDGQTSETKRKCAEVLANGFQTTSSTDVVACAPQSANLAPQTSNQVSQTQSNPAPYLSQTNNQVSHNSTSVTNQNLHMNSMQNFRYPALNLNVTGGNCTFHFHYAGTPSTLTPSNLQ